MHFCFWDHLHLSTGLKVISALQWSPYVSLNLRFSPLLLPPSLPPLLLLCCTTPPAPGPERRPAALRPSVACSTRRSVPPPAARRTRAGRPLLLHVGQTARAAATPPCQAHRRRPPLCVQLRDLSLPSSSFLRPCGAIKVDGAHFSPVALPLPPPHNIEPPPPIFPGILPNRNTPLRFRWPRASSPPPLAPQLDPVQPRPSPSPDLPHPEPPLTGAARARPHRRQHAPPPLHPIQVWESLPPCPLVLMRVLDAPVRRSFTENGGAPPRPPPLLAVGRVPPLPVEPRFVQLVPHSLLVIPHRPLPAGDLAAGKNTPGPSNRAVSRPGRDVSV
jgi:hypothetical protein